MSHAPSMSPREALDKLMEGNKRFVAGKMNHNNNIDAARRDAITKGQAPYATILGCSDSRVSLEHIFDAGLGDLFVCRNAGNILDEVMLGSIEYAAAHAGCPLLMVLGHQFCGAVTATVGFAQNLEHHESPSVDHIFRRLLPAVSATKPDEANSTSDWVEAATAKNVENICVQVKRESHILKSMIEKGDYKVIGAYYDLTTGEVKILDAAAIS